MALTRFDDTRSLRTPRLRALLHDGDAQERVWAAWRLALREGAAFLQTALALADTDPDAGARRHMAIVCAGFGGRRLVQNLAEHDRDPAVRDTAIRLMANCADGPDDRAAWMGRLPRATRRPARTAAVCAPIPNERALARRRNHFAAPAGLALIPR